LKTNVMI